MRRALFILAVFVLMAASGKDAHAKRIFGTQDRINHLQDLNLKGPNGEALYLGFLTSTHSFMLPYSMSDGGYVLGIKGVSDKFYRLPKEKIELMQRAGGLPNRLPVYRRTARRLPLGLFAVAGFADHCGRVFLPVARALVRRIRRDPIGVSRCRQGFNARGWPCSDAGSRKVLPN